MSWGSFAWVGYICKNFFVLVTQSPKTLGSRLRWLRHCFDLSLEEFGAPLGVTASYLSKLERGASENPSAPLLDSICRNFYVSRAWLTEGEGKPFLIAEYNDIAEKGERIDSPVPDRIRVPLPDNYIDQLRDIALFLENRGEEMSKRAEALEKQASDFEAFQVEKRKGEILQLTKAAIAPKRVDVKAQLPGLLERLQKATEAPGMKSELAEFLGVPLASVSRWLSGDREPGGETTLRMLRWLELQERHLK